MDKVVHFEIPYDDQKRAQKFYQDVFGWQISKFPDMDYYMATTCKTDPNTTMPSEPGAINGGLLQKDPTGKHPIIVIAVESVENYIKKIESSGRKVVMPAMKVGDFGIYARIADTEGNVIGLWQTLKK